MYYRSCLVVLFAGGELEDAEKACAAVRPRRAAWCVAPVAARRILRRRSRASHSACSSWAALRREICPIKTGSTPNVDALKPTIDWDGDAAFGGLTQNFIVHAIANLTVPTAG